MSLFDCPSMHMRHTEPDEEGYGVCLDCGAPVSCGVLTPAVWDRAVEGVLRHPHTMRCVRVERGQWICATECPLR